VQNFLKTKKKTVKRQKESIARSKIISKRFYQKEATLRYH